MKHPRCLLGPAILLLAFSVATAGEMKQVMKYDGSELRKVLRKFDSYPPQNREMIFPDEGGIRILLPEGVAGLQQTGLYSLVALAGDCEVCIGYELLKVDAPKSGYGCGVGVALDTEGSADRVSIQRVHRLSKGNGYALESVLKTGGPKPVFKPTTAEWGRLAMRRVKKEVIFLATEHPSAPLEEIDRLPFTDKTIRTVRFFADAGGSPTVVDIRLREIEVQAEELTGGTPQRDLPTPSWWPWLVIPGVGLLLFGAWYVRRRRA